MAVLLAAPPIGTAETAAYSTRPAGGARRKNKSASHLLPARAPPSWLASAVAGGPRRYQAFFGRLAPYFERACLRSLTPCRSSESRTMW